MIKQKKSYSYLQVILIIQATIVVVFFIYFHWYHHSTTIYGEYRSKVNYTTQELYTNGELLFNISLNDEEECVEQFVKKYLNYCNRALIPPEDILRSYPHRELPLCPCIPHSTFEADATEISSDNIQAYLESRKRVDQTLIASPLLSGGSWTPTGCIPRQRVAIIVAYRNRTSHLKIFLQLIHPFLQKQLIQYTIFIIEQVKPLLFNRASLFNVGFKEATTRGQFDCFIFHDVDALPEDDLNFYGCYKQPRHMAAYIDKHQYKLKYNRLFGCVNAFTRKQFEQANGFSNEFYGWGGEDDDLLNRIEAMNMTFLRFPNCIAKYTVFGHPRDAGNPNGLTRSVGLLRRPGVYVKNGLNSLVYEVEKHEKRRLYTWIAVSLPAAPLDFLQQRRKNIFFPRNISKKRKIVLWSIPRTSSFRTSSEQRTPSLETFRTSSEQRTPFLETFRTSSEQRTPSAGAS